jgi:hypothetical protein
MSEASDKLAAVRALVTASTQRLLGDTIGVDQEDWSGPSRLPRWSRGHVATHLARQADGLARLVEWARTGHRQEMYASLQAREDEIEAGAGRTGLELQVIAAVLLGGVSIFGGRGALHGVVAGVLLIGVISSALRLEDVTANIINIIIGLLLVASVMSTSFLSFVARTTAGIKRRAATGSPERQQASAHHEGNNS